LVNWHLRCTVIIIWSGHLKNTAQNLLSEEAAYLRTYALG